jgi:hypothetical protein
VSEGFSVKQLRIFHAGFDCVIKKEERSSPEMLRAMSDSNILYKRGRYLVKVNINTDGYFGRHANR